MKEETTIIIPSHDRHHLLLRAIDYYSELNFTVLIVDSSESFLDIKFPKNIKYMHLPDTSFSDKIYTGLCSVSTHFSCLCADDDFLAENGLKAGQEFLEENLDYISVQGHYIQFDPSIPQEKSNPLYLEMIDYKNDSDFIKNRVMDALTAVPHIYALHRTTALKNAMHIALDITNLTVVELSIPLVTMCYGKHAVLPVFWSARDVIRYSSYLDEDGKDPYLMNQPEDNKFNKVIVDWESFLKTSDGYKLKNNFIETVSDVVPDPKEARDLFNLANNNYLSRVRVKRNFFQTKLKDIIKLLLPNFIVIKIQLNNCEKLRFAVKSVSGYPWSDSVAMKDWDSMIKVILKFRDY